MALQGLNRIPTSHITDIDFVKAVISKKLKYERIRAKKNKYDTNNSYSDDSFEYADNESENTPIDDDRVVTSKSKKVPVKKKSSAQNINHSSVDHDKNEKHEKEHSMYSCDIEYTDNKPETKPTKDNRLMTSNFKRVPVKGKKETKKTTRPNRSK